MGLKFSALDKLISLMKSADYYLDAKTNQEIEERKTADNELTSKLESESSTRTTEDNKLQQQITTNKTEQDNKFKNYYNKTEVDQLVVDTQAIFYGDSVPVN